ncbi:Rieske (2Fe-2S) protein [Nocardioides sp. LS1]|uniref:Rieske (2Fe-2S) protein n=1 Tax=Nocardioides sp. LS1 TaxID=1027620 RepID=UPI000F616585|nr:Rieske (2Fe-2S) protein [Nocardioides sp. LS1]GCD89198.1 iron-sulfur protein [Nocardioides sp. LS1]
MTTEPGISRRHALAGAATVGVGLPLLAACGGGSDATTGASASPDAGPLGATADIPVGGGTVFADQKVVVTQPTAGEFKGFSATCTHQGCVVANVTETINCPCHGSKFSIEDGSVQAGPATRALPEVTVTVDGDQISIS